MHHLSRSARLPWRLHVSVVDPTPIPCIYVLAGTNGSGKTSLVGALLGQNYFNPDLAAQAILSKNPGITQAEANSAAWHEGLRLLKHAIAERLDFAFETTLGGHTITSLLELALSEGMEVRMLYVGLTSPELHIARVRSRVTRGGHDIPETKIRERYITSRANLARLLPKLTELFVYDNSEEADPKKGMAPEPKLILHMIGGTLVSACDLIQAPGWAKPILTRAAYAIRGTNQPK
jgi:predicted ABC-type ATPase